MVVIGFMSMNPIKIGSLKHYGWGEVGEKRYSIFREAGDSVTTLTAIT